MPRTDKEKGRIYHRKWYERNKEKIRQRNKVLYQLNKEHINKKAKEQIKRIKLEVFSYYSKGEPKCTHCGITELDVLCLDHIDGGGTKDRLFNNHHGSNLHYFLKRTGYPEGFQVLCANCNLRKWVKYKK
uniref:Uncharacterized protein n=2 Tax=viral metagenome TaxID=1070528 RepID=A0A6M3IQR9_9ZZZZ